MDSKITSIVNVAVVIVVFVRSWDGEGLAMGTWAAFVIGVSSLLLLKMFVFQF